MILNDLIKVTLSVGGATMDVTDDITEWDSFEILHERDETSGVLTSVSTPLGFKGTGMALLAEAFGKDGLYSSATLNVYKRGNYDNG